MTATSGGERFLGSDRRRGVARVVIHCVTAAAKRTHQGQTRGMPPNWFLCDRSANLILSAMVPWKRGRTSNVSMGEVQRWQERANEIAHRLQGYKGVPLSAGNLAGQVTGYQDEGAGVDEVLAVLKSAGQVPRSIIAARRLPRSGLAAGLAGPGREVPDRRGLGLRARRRFRRHRVVPDLRLAGGVGHQRLRRRTRRRGHDGLPGPAACGIWPGRIAGEPLTRAGTGPASGASPSSKYPSA